MTSSYKSRAEATADRACLARLHAALNAANNAMRLDECRLWTVGASRGYVSTWGDGQTWMLAVGSKTPRQWTFVKQRIAAFPGLAQLTQDSDEEGVFRLMRLPTPEEAAEIRRAAGVRQSSGSPSDGRRFTPAKTHGSGRIPRFCAGETSSSSGRGFGLPDPGRAPYLCGLLGGRQTHQAKHALLIAVLGQ